jgi:hypothetical protein
MKMLLGIARELMGLFVDDGMLAAGVLVIVAVAAIVAHLVTGIAAGVVLLSGLLLLLFANVMAARSGAKGPG